MAATYHRPAYGRRLIANIIDERAERNANSVAFAIQRSSDITKGFRDVTYAQFASAINQAAHWIERRWGGASTMKPLHISVLLIYDMPFLPLHPRRLATKSVSVFSVIPFQSTADQSNNKAFFLSPRNSLEAHLSLLEALRCGIFLVPKPAPAVVESILTRKTMRHVPIPQVDDWLNAEHVKPYLMKKTFEEARLDPFVALHTSGSTGLPKPVIVAQGTISANDAYQEAPAPTTLESWKDARVFLGMPPFHAAGLYCMFAMAIPNNSTIVLGPADISITDEVADAIHVHGIVQGNVLAPSLLVDIAQTPAYLDNLSKLKWIPYAGGPLPKDAGDLISTKTTVHSCLGATETAPLPLELRDKCKEDWQYLKFSPFLGADFRHHDRELYEMVIRRKAEYEYAQGVFATFPDLQEYSMKDVYSQHPSKPDLWRFEGRTDDIIIFLNSEKLNPVTMERTISSHPEVTCAIVVGTGYFQSSLLIEARQPPTSDAERAKLLNSIWPYVERANKDCPDFAVISRDLVLFTPPGKPMVRASKGTVLRKATLNEFTKEIQQAYEKPSSPTTTWINLDSFSSLVSTIYDIVSQELETDKLDIDTNLGTIGLDSLHIMNIVRKINSCLDHSSKYHARVLQHTVYYNPTVKKLAAAVKALVDGGAEVTDDRAVPLGIDNRIQHMQALLAANSANLPVSARAPVRLHEKRKTIILTGSTGSLGCYLLDRLLADKTVVKIYCFERVHYGATALDRQSQAMKSHGLNADIPLDRVSFVEVDLAQPYFGLPRSKYFDLLRTVTHILHDAWEVNFELPLDNFVATHVHGVRSFVDFSAYSTHGAFIFFISSISSIANWPIEHEKPAPEQIIEDWSVSEEMGYAESKLLSERILASASHLAGIPTATVRVGQIAGPTTKAGYWNKQEWFPSLIVSSKFLNMIPETLGTMDMVDWIPVNILATVIVELLMIASDFRHAPTAESNEKARATAANSYHSPHNGAADLTTNTQIFHTTNPSHTTYSQHLLPTILAHLPHDIQKVPFEEWVSALANSNEDPEHNPGQKLLDFYENMVKMEKSGRKMVVLDTHKTTKCSPTLAGLEAVKKEWMDTWMMQWGYTA